MPLREVHCTVLVNSAAGDLLLLASEHRRPLYIINICPLLRLWCANTDNYMLTNAMRLEAGSSLLSLIHCITVENLQNSERKTLEWTWLLKSHSFPLLFVVFSAFLLLSLRHLHGQILDESGGSVCWWKLQRIGGAACLLLVWGQNYRGIPDRKNQRSLWSLLPTR